MYVHSSLLSLDRIHIIEKTNTNNKTNLHHKYSNQLAEERKDRAYRSELLGRVRILNSTVRGSVKQEDENDEEFVVVEMSDGSDNSEEQEWEKDDWDMTVVMEVMEVVEVEDEVKMVE